MRVVTLTTDFGLEDGYVAAMKGVILGLAPDAVLVDVSHQVPPQDVLRTTLLLESILPSFAADTIHVVVVDPGVGTARRPIAAHTNRGAFVAPDNGVLTCALVASEAPVVVHLTEASYFRRPVSPTFHGRDIFASVAGHLARGVQLGLLGEPIHDAVRLQLAAAIPLGSDEWRGEITYVDHFGNLVTNLRGQDLPEPGEQWIFEVGGRILRGLRRTYGDAPVGELLVLVGSGGWVEIAQRDGDAAHSLDVGRGARLVARRAP